MHKVFSIKCKKCNDSDIEVEVWDYPPTWQEPGDSGIDIDVKCACDYNDYEITLLERSAMAILENEEEEVDIFEEEENEIKYTYPIDNE